MTIVVFDLLMLFALSLFFWSGWDIKVNEFFRLVFFQEAVVVLLSLIIYSVWFVYLLGELRNVGPARKMIVAFLVIFGISAYGAGMHQGANQVGLVIDASVVRFYDEVLSHYLFYSGVIGLAGMFAFLQLYVPMKTALGRYGGWFIGTSGVFHGLVVGLGMLEGNVGFWGMVLMMSLLAGMVYKLKGRSLNKYPLALFYRNFLVGGVVLLVVWAVWERGFIEPSVVGFGRF